MRFRPFSEPMPNFVDIVNRQFDAIIKEHGFFGCNQMTRKEMARERDCSLQNIGFLYRKGVSKIREKLYTEEE